MNNRSKSNCSCFFLSFQFRLFVLYREYELFFFRKKNQTLSIGDNLFDVALDTQGAKMVVFPLKAGNIEKRNPGNRNSLLIMVRPGIATIPHPTSLLCIETIL